MENQILNMPQVISLRPISVFAFIKVLPLLICTSSFLFLAWWVYPALIWLGLLALVMAFYRFSSIRTIRYLITPKVVRVSRGIFFKQTDQVKLFRVKDYVITQSFLLQLFRLMDLELRSTDPLNPVIWLRGVPQSNLVDLIRKNVQEGRQYNRIYEIN